jgi:AraC-like DNA-binding protein
MRQDNAQNSHDATVQALTVHSIWHVDADASYDVTVGPWHWRRLVAIRTLAGEGELRFSHDVTVTAAAKSLVLTSGAELRRYRCPGPRWHFWWLELDVPVPVALPVQQVLAIPAVAAEKRLLRLAFAALRQDPPARANVAAAASQLLMHLWQAQWDGTQHASHQQTLVDRVIELMHRHLGAKGRLTVGDMAAAARLSVPHFHRIFHVLTGQAPKPFYDGLRLDRARQLLSQRQLNVSETAATLGFSSPFHFSRAYKKRFGIAPSHVSHSPDTP